MLLAAFFHKEVKYFLKETSDTFGCFIFNFLALETLILHGTMGRGRVETKVNKGACYWVWDLCDKILACLKKDPSCFSKHPEQCFLRPNLNFFLEFHKIIWFAISITLKMTIQNYFFVKKVCKKKSPIKFFENVLSKKGTSEHMLLIMKSMWKNTCLFEKRSELLQETSGTMFFMARYNFFSEFLKKTF